MADQIDINEFFPSIPNIAEEFVKRHHGEKHTKEEWWELFGDFLDEAIFEDICSDDCDCDTDCSSCDCCDDDDA